MRGLVRHPRATTRPRLAGRRRGRPPRARRRARQRLGQPERGGDQPVGEPGVLGQQRAVQVGADHVARRTPSRPSLPLLPWPLSTRPSGRAPGPEMGPATVVLEPGQDPPAPGLELDLDRDVADQPRPVRSGPCAGRPARRREAPRRPAGRSARAAGSRRRPRGSPRRGSAAACSASRLSSARSSAHSCWSRSCPPPM